MNLQHNINNNHRQEGKVFLIGKDNEEIVTKQQEKLGFAFKEKGCSGTCYQEKLQNLIERFFKK